MRKMPLITSLNAFKKFRLKFKNRLVQKQNKKFNKSSVLFCFMAMYPDTDKGIRQQDSIILNY